MEQETYIESTAVQVLSQSYKRPQVNPTVDSNPCESSAAVKQEAHVAEVINRSDRVLMATSDVTTDDDESEYTAEDSESTTRFGE